jgi:putative ABC transport system permease protein
MIKKLFGLWAALRRQTIQQDIDSELAYHVQMRARDLEKTGMGTAAARREAERRFGNHERIRAECREVMMVDAERQGDGIMAQFGQDLRYAVRTILKNPGFAATVILTLGLGIGANTAIFSVVDGVLLRPLPYADADRIVYVAQNDRLRGTQNEWFSGPDFFDVLERNVVFESMAAWRTPSATLTSPDGEPQRISTASTSHTLFSILGAGPALGRVYDADDDRPGVDPVVVLSHRIWVSRFGAADGVLGRLVALEGTSYEVIGVMPPGFDFPSSDTEVWTPLQISAARTPPRGNHFYGVIAKLREGVNLDAANGNLTAIAADLEAEYADDNLGRGMWTQGLLEAMVGPVRPALLMLLGAVGLVLAIACVNVASLLFARSTVRHREVAIRGALGAGRNRLIRQFLTESLVLSLLGGAAGLLVAVGGVRGLVALGPAALPRLANVGIDGRVLLFAIIASVGTGVLFGILPALQAAGADLQSPLREGGRMPAQRGGRGMRQFLVVTEVALAAVLVTGAGLLIQSFWRLQAVDPGFAAGNVLVANVQLPASRYPQAFGSADFAQVLAFQRELVERVAGLPKVESVSLAVHHPANPGWTSRFTIDGRPPVPPGEQEEARINPVGGDFFRTVGIQVIRGRAFDEGDRADGPPVVIINETCARRHFTEQEPVGQRLSFWGQSREIVGVVADVKFRGPAQETRQGWYAPMEQIPFAAFSVLVRTAGEPLNVAAVVQQQVLSIDPDLPVFGVSTLEQQFSGFVAQPRFNMLLLGIFAGVAMVLAAVGIYGVISYGVSQRTHEIGVRISLGATAGDVLRQVVGQGLVLAAAGVAIGLGTSLLFSRALSSLLFGVGAVHLPTFVAVALIVSVVAFAASYLPARRASNVDPMLALRSE